MGSKSVICMGFFNFSTQCICMGTGSLFAYIFFSRKCAPSMKEHSICGSENMAHNISWVHAHSDISLTFVMIVVCSTETSTTIRWFANAINSPCFAECGWLWVQSDMQTGDWSPRRQFKFVKWDASWHLTKISWTLSSMHLFSWYLSSKRPT